MRQLRERQSTSAAARERPFRAAATSPTIGGDRSWRESPDPGASAGLEADPWPATIFRARSRRPADLVAARSCVSSSTQHNKMGSRYFSGSRPISSCTAASCSWSTGPTRPTAPPDPPATLGRLRLRARSGFGTPPHGARAPAARDAKLPDFSWDHKGRLERVVDVIGVRRDLPADREDHRPMPNHDRLERDRVVAVDEPGQHLALGEAAKQCRDRRVSQAPEQPPRHELSSYVRLHRDSSFPLTTARCSILRIRLSQKKWPPPRPDGLQQRMRGPTFLTASIQWPLTNDDSRTQK